MPVFLVFLLIAIPLLELWVIANVADAIGVLETIVLLITVSLAGAWLLAREGLATWRRLRETLAQGELPTRELTDGALILLGGALLLTPGFVTDVVGLTLLFPRPRAVFKGAFRRFLAWWTWGRLGPAGGAGKAVYDARVTRVRRADEPTSPRPRDPAPTLPSSARPSGEDDSRGTG